MNPEKSSSEKFRNRLRSLRHEKGLNQENMADMVGMSGSWVAKVEEGVIKLDLDKLEHFSKTLDVDILYFLGMDGFTPPHIN